MLSESARKAAAALIDARNKGAIGETFEAERGPDNMVTAAGGALSGISRTAFAELDYHRHIRITGANSKFTVKLLPLLSADVPPAPNVDISKLPRL